MKIIDLKNSERKICDIFTFFNEFELLELRLEILSPYVDMFFIIESPLTFSGKSKPLYFLENCNRYDRWKEKIVHFVIDNPLKSFEDASRRLIDSHTSELDKALIRTAFSSPNVPKGQFHWLSEFYQKESIKKALINLAPFDICFVSDLDEIWNPHMDFEWSDNVVFRLQQNVYQYFLNNLSSEYWNKPILTCYKNIDRSVLNHVRQSSSKEDIVIQSAGWHFTFQGGAERIRYKIESYGHQEFNNRRVKSRVDKRIQANRDLYGRKIKFLKDESMLPAEVIALKKKYPSWFL